MKTQQLFLLLSISMLLLFSSCDPCLNVNCVNGTCVDGDCECDAGYTGTNCEDQIASNELIVFVSEDCGCGQITVNITGGQTETITGFYSSGNPACGATGAANFTTNAGNILVNAYCNGINWSATVNVAVGSCTKLKLNCDGTTGSGGNTSGYNCVSGTCASVSSNANYSTLSDCQNDCGNSSGYDCVSGTCISVSSNADYSTLSDCQSACNWSSAGYNCVSGSCTSVSSNAQYSTLSACQSNCSVNNPCSLLGGNTYYGVGNNCGSSGGHVSPSKCCPLSSPYWCAYTNQCYTSCDDAFFACENQFPKVFKALSSTNPPSPYGAGEVIFYVTSPITCGQLRVYLTEVGGSTTNKYITEPSTYTHCGAKGGATFEASPGDYTYQATCGSQTWDGSFTISAYQCKKVMIF